MLTRHHGLVILLLFAVVGHASLSDWIFERRSPGFQIGFALILAPIVLVMLGEWIAQDAETRRWRRGGFAIAIVGAVWHLILDAACLALPWIGAAEWKFGLGGAALGALVMALALRQAWRGWRNPYEPEPDPAALPPPVGLLARLGREASLMGGTSIALMLISLGMVAMACVGLARHPQRPPLSVIGAAGFFALCAAAGLWMGLERRAMLLGLPAPLAGLRWRSRRRPVVVAAREGLAQLTRHGATIYAWADIDGLSLGQLYNNAALFVTLREGAPAEWRPAPGRLAEPGEEAKRLRSEQRGRSVQRALCGADLAIMSVLTEEGPGILSRQVGEALGDPTHRASLPTVDAFMERMALRGTTKES